MIIIFGISILTFSYFTYDGLLHGNAVAYQSGGKEPSQIVHDDLAYYGKMVQDEDDSATDLYGDDADPIKWIIALRDNGDIMMTLKDGIMGGYYGMDANYEQSNAREWLNGKELIVTPMASYMGFLNAFTDNELHVIKPQKTFEEDGFSNEESIDDPQGDLMFLMTRTDADVFFSTGVQYQYAPKTPWASSHPIMSKLGPFPLGTDVWFGRSYNSIQNVWITFPSYPGGYYPVPEDNDAYTQSYRATTVLDKEQLIYATNASNNSLLNALDNNGSFLKAAPTDDIYKLILKETSLKLDVINQDEFVPKHANLQIHYQNATTGSDLYITAYIKDNSGQVVRYGLMKKTDLANGEFQMKTDDLPVGLYQVVLFNQKLTEDKTSGLASEKVEFNLEILDAPKIDFKANQPLIYGNDNVTANTNGFIGTVTSDKPNTAFSLQNSLTDTNTPSDFIIANQTIKTTKSLDAGNYTIYLKGCFADICSNAQSYSFEVQKADADIAFQNPSETKKSILDANISWIEQAKATPDTGTKITYTKIGGDVGLIDIDANMGQITYKGNGAFGKVKIRATVDDDPSTGKDNYNPAFVEKEIVIYREVDGVITPDPASSDINIPTFSMDKPNIKTGGTIGTIKGTLGTPDTIDGSTTTYSYEIKQDPNDDGSLFQVNATTGVIKANANLGVDTYNFIIIVSDKWSSKEIPVTVNVGMSPAENLKFYENSTSNTVINTKTVTLTDTGVSVYATVKGSSNNNPVSYKLNDGEPTNVIDVNPNSGAITLKNVGTVVIIAEKQGSNGQANAIAELTFTVKAGSQEFIYTDVGGNELPKNGTSYKDYEEIYGKGKTFQLYTSGGSSRSTMDITYALQAGSPTDVISVDQNGLVTILNASLNTQIGQVIVEATSHDPSGNYTDKTIELPITITKADQTISFKNVTPAQSGKGKVTPIIVAQDISSSEGGITVNDTNYHISVDASANGVAWTNNGVDIEYNYSGDTAIEIPLHVEKAGNRNYNKAEADGKMRILSPNESNLSINQPGKIYYGDHFTIRSLQDDSSSTNVNYTFEVDNTIFVSNPIVNGNTAEFDALKCSNGAKINITVTRTADSEVTLSKTISVEVLPKDINVNIDDKTKQKGEENPPLTFQDFTSQLVSWNGVQDVVDLNDVVLSTTATATSKAGSYPITGNSRTMNTTYPNYNFIFKEGKLMIDSNIDKDVDGDGKPDFNDPDGDGCPDLNIKWKDDNGDWVIINGDRDYDGIPDLNIDSDGDGIPDLNIDTDKDGLPDINLVILKKSDWKPTKCVVQSTTVKEEYCTGTSVKPQINVDTDKDRIPNINIDNNGDMEADLNVSKDGVVPSTNIIGIHEWKPKHDYSQNGFTYDSIGTDPDEPKRETNIDTDGDGRPDVNIDFDGDGKPDINIDMDGDEIPDIDIDTNGDGKPDINVDTNGDGKADENIYEIEEWKPNKDGNKDGFPYDTIEIERKPDLEDNGIKVEKPDGTPFLPNYAIRVEDVTEDKQTEITASAKDIIEEKQEVKKVFDVKLFKDNIEVQPDGTLKIKIPCEDIKHPILIRKNASGNYERVEYTIEDGYMIYETDELGIVSIIGDKEFETSVQGTYTPNVGGALTGDESNIYFNFIMVLVSLIGIMYLRRKKQKDTFQ